MPFYKTTGEPIELGREIARGGQGVIYEVLGNPHGVAKIYTSPSLGFESKLMWMKNNPPEDPTRSQGHASLAWPTELVYDEHAIFAGYLMPYIHDAVLSLEVYHPYLRALSFPDFNLKYLTRAARNLASALGAIHARGYVVGDLNESNVLITRSALITLIDNDSFQVHEARQERIVVYPCPVGKPEYTPPELYGKSLAGELRRPEHDSFALAVLIFQLLMEGNHPFRSRWLGSDDPPSIEEKIFRGYFPYHKSLKQLVVPPPDSPPIGILHPNLVNLFTRCFIDGCHDNQKRPSPAEWEWALKEAEKSFIVCKNQHCFSDHLKACPECGSPRAHRPKSKSIQTTPFVPGRKDGFAKNQNQAESSQWSFVKTSQHQRERLLLWIAVLMVVGACFFLFLNFPFLNSVSSKDLAVANQLPAYGTSDSGNRSNENPDKSPNISLAANSSPKSSEPVATKLHSPAPSPTEAKPSPTKISASPSVQPKPSNSPVSPSPTVVKSKSKRKPPVNPSSLVILNSDIKRANTTPANYWMSPSPERRINTGNATELTSLTKITDLGGVVLGLDYSHSIALAAAASQDKTIKIWHPRNHSLSATLTGHSKKVSAVAFSPDGTLVASGSDDKTVMVWRTGSGALQKTLAGHSEKITCLAFSPDGKLLGAGSTDNSIIIWDLKSDTIQISLSGHREDISCIAFSPNGKVLASGSNDNTVCLWNTGDGTLIGTLNAHYMDITSLAFSPDGKKLISGSKDNTVRIWDTHGLVLLKTLKTQNAIPNCIEYSQDGEIFAVGYSNGVIRIWSSDTQTLLNEISCSESAIKSLSFATTNSMLLAGSSDGSITVIGIP